LRKRRVEVRARGMKSPVWWLTPISSAPWRLRHGDGEFYASLSYIERPCLKNQAD
jgi:hypothetical protein